MQGALRRVYTRIEELGALEKLAILHTRSAALAKDVVEDLKTRIGYKGRPLVQDTGAVLASHAGPGAIAVVAITAE